MAGRELGSRLEAVTKWPGAELSGLAAIGIKEGRVVFEGAWGRRRIDEADPSRDLPVRPDTKFRVGSISKISVALVAMRLVERGLIDLRRDLSDYLGWKFRNPAWPHTALTAEMLFSHTSSLRDIEAYNLPLGRRIEEFFTPGSEAWAEGAHFARPEPGRDLSPGAFYSYANLGFGIMGTVFERITGRRFDLLMREELFEPLGIDASFNINLLSEASFANVATLYRKGREDGHWDPKGPWVAQFDDHRGLRPTTPCRLAPGLGPEALEAYEPGTNGTLFSPQGGMRASVRDLAALGGLFLEGGKAGGGRILSEASIEEMMRPRWTWDSRIRNGNLEGGPSRQSGLGLFRVLGSADEGGSDRLLPSGGPRPWGHHGEAYGLLGRLAFDRGGRWCFAYIIGGVGCDPMGFRGEYSAAFRWEEEIQRAFVEELGLDSSDH